MSLTGGGGIGGSGGLRERLVWGLTAAACVGGAAWLAVGLRTTYTGLMSISDSKRRRTSSPSSGMKIGTHNGTFHCDEALACFMLKQLDTYKDAEIVRSRDPAVLNACDVVVDVGATYDAAKLRFDHHQRGFEETLDEDHDIKLSSAGLVYKHFGRQLIRKVLNANDDDTELLFYKIYKEFIEAIDGIDNGVQLYDTDDAPKYRVNTDVSARVGKLNPWWNAEEQDTDVIFPKAMELVGEELMSTMKYYGQSWLPARQILADAVAARTKAHPSGKVLKLTQFVPWKDHLFTLEKEGGFEIVYVLYQDTAGKWRVQCVPERPGSFTSRLPLPEEWRGLRDAELSDKSGIDGCVFVHAAGFIGGNNTYEGVLEMVDKALK